MTTFYDKDDQDNDLQKDNLLNTNKKWKKKSSLNFSSLTVSVFFFQKKLVPFSASPFPFSITVCAVQLSIKTYYVCSFYSYFYTSITDFEYIYSILLTFDGLQTSTKNMSR